MKFKKGDRVMLVPDCRWFEDNPGDFNPPGVIGTVTDFYDNFDIWVTWDNEEKNLYVEEDLMFATKLARVLAGDENERER